MQQSDQALRELKAAQQIRIGHLGDGGDTSKLHRDLALGYYSLGVQELRATRDPKLGHAQQLEHQHAAEKDFADSITELRQLIERDPRDLTLQYQLATCYRMAGDADFQSSPESAAHRYQQALETLARLVERNPGVSEYKAALAGSYMNLAIVQHGANSIASFEQARIILLELVEKEPGNSAFSHDLAATVLALAERQNEAGLSEAARGNFASSVALLERLQQQLPNDPHVAEKLAEARAALKQLDEKTPSPPRR